MNETLGYHCKDSASRRQKQIKLDFNLILLRRSLSYEKIVQAEDKSK